MEGKMGVRALQILRARASFGSVNFARGFAGSADREGAETRLFAPCERTVRRDSLAQSGRIVAPGIHSRRWNSSVAASSTGAVLGPLKGNKADVAIIGGGIVGLATAREITQRFPKLSVVVLEKENDLVRHQTSHNSGVIHAGIYYQPGTEMARLCVDGARRMYKYCERNDLPHERVGKLIVATRERELPVLEDLHQRATANGVQGLELLSPKQITDLEPNVRALRALHSPNTGIANYARIALSYADDFLRNGRGQIRTGFNAKNVSADEVKGVEVQAKTGETVKARWLITCAGLQSDYVGKMAGGAKGPTVLPFRGTYHELRPEFRNLIKRNIYPVPDPAFPMVGVHLTPRTDGRVLIGPNSALALAKEGYKFWHVNLKDAITFGLNRGLWKLVLGNPGIVFQEIWRDINTKAFVREAQRYCPKLQVEHTTTGWAGVHAVAIDDSGQIVGNFLFESLSSGVVLNVRNAPSPACTSSLAIATTVVDRAAKDFAWKGDQGTID
ncbi:hypothetical protein MPTK1_3g09290 [Marchantia polymorpha subsp. ruderalis]|uniref:L-2-hydroxyglutarate dehydrogenase, mitochondrial n=2 Tax=Marchantia polymorpha TaxID=3197 RepID=A0AAF6AYZ8_MARPO|nr:hypothetical protein MARPO_0085s0100 [Marchantia polymorpha]BBN04982.1 hypothetical protein Mp_3g09290 [Marchantia polymorpha subsp. ruderalis]|eukprot:PTQ33897.1 hypothetical protein MARPO_0085s0100 [Marchantia polymorpha]